MGQTLYLLEKNTLLERDVGEGCKNLVRFANKTIRKGIEPFRLIFPNRSTQVMQKLRGIPLRLVVVPEALIADIQIRQDSMNQCNHIFAGPVIFWHQVRDS